MDFRGGQSIKQLAESLGVPPPEIRQVIQRIDLTKRIAPFQRCLRRNHPVEPVQKEAVLDRLAQLTKLYSENRAAS